MAANYSRAHLKKNVLNLSHETTVKVNARQLGDALDTNQTEKLCAMSRPIVIASFIMAIALALVFDARVDISLDEGIYLHGGQRILAGNVLYRDFFALTGPGTFWLDALWLRLLAASYTAAHLLLTMEISGIVAVTFLIAGNVVSRLSGITAAACTLGLFLLFSNRIYVSHRWDSTCCVVIATALLVLPPTRTKALFVAGLLSGCAVIFTPPTILFAASIILYFVLCRSQRSAAWFLVAALIPVAFAAGTLAMQGGLLPMLHDFIWVSRNYSGANSVFYGFSPSEAGDISRVGQRGFFGAFFLHVPALLPILACALGLVAFRKTSPVPAKLLLIAGFSLAAACYPRLATNNLLFAAPLLIASLFALGSPLVKTRRFRTICFALLAISSTSIFWLVTGRPPVSLVATQLGTVQCKQRDLKNVEFATGVINPGDSLFVYPYQPIWYSLTGGVNPTRFDFLQPGMMTLNDEATALAELNAKPPEWVIWHNLPPRDVLAIWPNSNRDTLRFRRIEDFIRKNYGQVHSSDPKVHYEIAIFRHIVSNTP